MTIDIDLSLYNTVFTDVERSIYAVEQLVDMCIYYQRTSETNPAFTQSVKSWNFIHAVRRHDPEEQQKTTTAYD